MKGWIGAVLGSILFFSPAPGPSGEEAPPSTFVDTGACPFECCQYGPWKVEKTTKAFALPHAGSKPVGTFVSGTHVVALTGEVHTVPSKFHVRKANGAYKPGDVLWVYTYLGEGVFKVWFQGKMVEADLGFSPYGGSAGNRCQESEGCWGELDKEMQFTWWIKIKSPEGWVGWTTQGENFSGKDACG